MNSQRGRSTYQRTGLPPLDLSRVDLLGLIERDTRLRRVARTHGGEYAGPCPFCGGDDRFRVWPEHPSGRGEWWCRRCERGGDAVDYVRARHNLDFVSACEWLGLDLPGRDQRKQHISGAIGQAPPTNKHVEEKSLPLSTLDRKHQIMDGTPPPSEWQKAALKITAQCEAALWTASGAKARSWLSARGINEATCRAWRLGYHGEDDRIGDLYVPRGIVIPCFCGPALWYVKVRRPVPPFDGPKYWQVKGSKLTLFGLDRLAGRPEIVICEGELDATLLWQLAGDLVDVIAVAGATQRPNAQALLRLAEYRRWLVAFDNDDAGAEGADWWGFAARTRTARPLQGKDLTDFHLAGGDLRAWVEFLLAKEGQATPRGNADQAATVADAEAITLSETPPSTESAAAAEPPVLSVAAPSFEPTAAAETPAASEITASIVLEAPPPAPAEDAANTGSVQYPVALVWPANAKIAVISDQWRRLEDGRIEATYNDRDELAWCMEATRLLSTGQAGHETKD
jgi:hypothetical protein